MELKEVLEQADRVVKQGKSLHAELAAEVNKAVVEKASKLAAIADADELDKAVNDLCSCLWEYRTLRRTSDAIAKNDATKWPRDMAVPASKPAA
jgi:hypothetical protein